MKAKKVKNKYGIKWIFGQAKGAYGWLIMYGFFAVLVKLAELSVAFLLKAFTDIAMGDADYDLMKTGLLAAGVVLIFGLFYLIMSYFRSVFTGKAEGALRNKFLSAVFKKKMKDISEVHTGEIQTRITADVSEVCGCYTNIIESLLAQLLGAAAALVILFILNWKMSLIVLSTIPVLLIVMGVFSPALQRAAKRDKGNDEAHRTFMQEAISRIILIKSYFMRGKIIEQSGEIYKKKIKSGITAGLWGGSIVFLGNVFGYSIFMLSLGAGAYFIMRNELTIGTLIAIIQLMNYIVNPIANLSAAIAKTNQAIVSAGRLGEIFEMGEDNVVSCPPALYVSELKTEGLAFAYKEKEIFSDINMKFVRGEITAIAGKSGSGKSTLLKLIIGLYPPLRGSAELVCGDSSFINGDILSQIAYVPPDEYLFSGSVKENIRMADENNDEDFLRECAEKANISEFIDSLPQGFDTILSEGGGNVSSGQAQRIAIARALFKRSPVIVFDEPTANLDIKSIMIFQETLRAISGDKIIIVVTHEQSTIDACDFIYVLGEGSIIECGAPKEISYRIEENAKQ